jgi:murein L,D-transpeptidase YcbB/YkuD
VVKSVRFKQLLASTGFGLILALSCHASLAQQSEQQIREAVPMPDLSPLPPPTVQDIEPAKPAPAAIATEAPKQDAAAPVTGEPKQDAATPPAKATAAPQTPPSLDTQVAEQLRDLITGKQLDRFVRYKDDRAGVEQFYREHDYKPIWTSDGKADARAKAVVAFLSQVEPDGLDSSDYPTPDLAAAVSPEDLARAELHLTASVLKYARQAQIGRIHFSRVGPDISFKLDAPEAADVLAKLSGADDVAKVLDSYNPPQPGFKALKAKLAELRAAGGQIAAPAEAKPAAVRVPEGKILRPGMKDGRVIALRKRLDVGGDKNNPLYDDEVMEAVKAFQTQAELYVDGMLGPNTVRALNGDVHEGHKQPNNPIDTVIVNMERWRWLPRKLGNDEHTYVMVNVPDFTLKLMHDGEVDWKTKIVAGLPSKATPMTSAEMKYITVNPTWNVPPSIIENEYLPAIQADPTVLDRYGLKIYQDRDGTVHIYQPPGAGNALGRIRFNFPNKFLVYQHDTPEKYLFKRDKRAYSHGCMRVEDPLEYATKLLALELPQDRYTPAKLEGMYGNNEININLPNPIPVHLTYQTAFVDQNGKLQFRDDVYGRDAKMIAILKNRSERRMADIPVENASNPGDQPVRLPAGTYGAYGSDNGYGGYNGRYGGPSFFDFLFGPQRPYRPRGYVGPHANNNNNSGPYTRR